MKKIPIYEIIYTIEKKVTGVDDRQILDFIDPENDSPERYDKYQEIYFDFIGDDFDLGKFNGDKKAKPTDMLSSNFLTTSGFFISQAFSKLLEGFIICNARYRDVYIKGLSEKKEYRFLNLSVCPNIDFKQSSFVIKVNNAEKDQEEIKLSSLDDFKSKLNKLRSKNGFGYRIQPQKLVLKQKYDLFRYEISGRFLISAELKNALEKSDLKGYKIKPFDLEVFI